MTPRKEVFKSKVLQKLYPAAPTLEKKPSPPRIVEGLAKKTHVRKKAFQCDTTTGQTQGAAVPSPRIYTVLPPPEDYKKHLGKPVPIPQLESINTARNPADGSVHDVNEELKQDEALKRNGRRWKRKPSGQGGAPGGSESGAGQNPTEAVVEAGEHVSRNKKRKLKKKRHKEKLISMGVMPRAAALVFTYEKAGEEEEEEKRAAEVSDFLRTTLETYVSDSHPHVDKLRLLPGTVENLLSRISSGCKPNTALVQLYNLKACVQQKEVDKLGKALKELPDSSCMSAEETAAVASLFQYWITDILPMQGDETTRLSTAHP
ncbi:hypothetical protein JOB18_023272 [Solea senegalensis]|nr:glutamate-rich protein 1 [Solea senegalensis]KAG7510498.1 hypothetical protein JOB18_023272 [Solea senegalensis]